MFTQSCFVRKCNKKLRKKLRDLGYLDNTCFNWLKSVTLTLGDNYYTYKSYDDFRNSHSTEFVEKECIDCGNNEELFLAIAALRDDTDAGQWFVDDKDSWEKCNSDLPSHYMQMNGNKATVEELIKMFGHKSVYLEKCIFIDSKLKEVLDKLKSLGYKEKNTTSIDLKQSDAIIIEDGEYYLSTKWLIDNRLRNRKSYINCRYNKDLFLALAAKRNDTDKDQWFVLECNLTDLVGNNMKPSGTFVLCDKDTWNEDFLEDGSPNPYSSKNIPAHKATTKELIKHFLG